MLTEIKTNFLSQFRANHNFGTIKRLPKTGNPFKCFSIALFLHFNLSFVFSSLSITFQALFFRITWVSSRPSKKAYFKRYQVKLRRKREGKTDYYATKRLTVEDKNKYNTPKYRLIVRITNKDIVAQLAYSKIEGDVVVASANAHELTRYGLKAGLTNYAAAYATGLLLARRHLKAIGLDSTYKGLEELTGEDYNVEEEGDRAPFKAVLDIGLARTTTGSKIFAVMKGVADGGINVPHSESRFFGFNQESKEYNAEAHRDRILGKHVADYMAYLKEEDEDRYKRQFSKLIAAGLSSDKLVGTYQKVHSSIRADPSPSAKKAAKPSKRDTAKKLTYDEKKQAVADKKALLLQLKEQQE